MQRHSRRSLLRASGAAAVAGLASLAGCDAVATVGLPEAPERGPAFPADPTGATSTFRGGLARRGYYPEHDTPAAPAAAWSRPVNTGDHTAAKASAVPLYPGRSTGEAAGVVVPGDDGRVRAFDAAGDRLWAAAVEPAERGVHGTPTVAGDTVYVGAYDGALYALDRATGERRWRVRLGDAVGSSPAYHDGRVYLAVEFAPYEGSLFAVDARTGVVEAEAPAPTDHPHSTPALAPAADRVVVGANDGDVYGFTLDLDRDRSWEVHTDGAVKGPVAVHDGAAFVGSWDRHLYRIDLRTGTVAWRHATGGKVMSGPAVDPRRGVVYVGSHDRRVHAVGVDGEPAWRSGTGGWITGCPSVVGDRVLVGSYDGHLYALDPESGDTFGDRAWSLELDGWVTASPRPVGDAVYVAERATETGPGAVYAVT
ncbi:hypothetical protein BRD13_04590 [Halobacteriales archaeon SW_5_70_135]|nr:MAG: hypothetical protein BRD13_04590 [Halobacteriales archaeon SW_5_70_135]